MRTKTVEKEAFVKKVYFTYECEFCTRTSPYSDIIIKHEITDHKCNQRLVNSEHDFVFVHLYDIDTEESFHNMIQLTGIKRSKNVFFKGSGVYAHDYYRHIFMPVKEYIDLYANITNKFIKDILKSSEVSYPNRIPITSETLYEDWSPNIDVTE